jgi:hypothetical protein
LGERNKIKNNGIYLLSALTSSIIFIAYFSLTEFINNGLLFNLGFIIILSIFSIPAYFIGGVFCSVVIDFIKKRFLDTLPNPIRFVICLILYTVAGVLVALIVFAILRSEDKQFPWGDFEPFAEIGIIASLLYYFVLNTMRWFLKVKSKA